MDFELSDEQQLIRETARDFTDHEIVERARENDRNEHFDLELVAKIAQQGYLGAIVPREYGGAGLDYLTYGLVVEQVGRGCSAMPTKTDFSRRRFTTRWACVGQTRPLSRSTMSGRRRTRYWERWAMDSRWR